MPMVVRSVPRGLAAPARPPARECRRLQKRALPERSGQNWTLRRSPVGSETARGFSPRAPKRFRKLERKSALFFFSVSSEIERDPEIEPGRIESDVIGVYVAPVDFSIAELSRRVVEIQVESEAAAEEVIQSDAPAQAAALELDVCSLRNVFRRQGGERQLDVWDKCASAWKRHPSSNVHVSDVEVIGTAVVDRRAGDAECQAEIPCEIVPESEVEP